MLRRISRGINFLFGKNLQKENLFISNSLEFLERQRIIDKNYFDYIRIATL